MSPNENVKVKDNIQVDVTTTAGQPNFRKVKVTSKDGILKNGTRYAEGSEAILELAAAERFVETGEVEIVDKLTTDEYDGHMKKLEGEG